LSKLAGTALGVVCHGKNPVDCVKVAAGKLFSKSVDGTVSVLDLESGKTVTTWKVEDCAKPGAKDLLDGLTSFGVDPAGEFLAVGNGEGEVSTYDVSTGQVINTVDQDRDFKHLNLVRAAGVSKDCRHVHACFGPGIVWRFEVVPELDDEEDGTEGPGTPPEDGN
jgi:WD40 repeat protein